MKDEWINDPEFLGKEGPPVRIGRGNTFDRRMEIAFRPLKGPLRGVGQIR